MDFYVRSLREKLCFYFKHANRKTLIAYVKTDYLHIVQFYKLLSNITFVEFEL